MHGHTPVAGCQGQRIGLQQPPLMRHQPPNPGVLELLVTCAQTAAFRISVPWLHLLAFWPFSSRHAQLRKPPSSWSFTGCVGRSARESNLLDILHPVLPTGVQNGERMTACGA